MAQCGSNIFVYSIGLDYRIQLHNLCLSPGSTLKQKVNTLSLIELNKSEITASNGSDQGGGGGLPEIFQ